MNGTDYSEILDPETFDERLNELREIRDRMENYDHTTPFSKVCADQERAEELAIQLTETIDSILA